LAHAEQQTKALTMVLAKHVRPWLDRVPKAAETKPERCSGLRALDVARAHVGWRETGPNKGDLVQRSLAGCVRDGRPLGIRDGVPWCAAFVGLCDSEAGAMHVWRAAVRELVSDAVVHRTWREFGQYVPQPGDLAIFKRGGKNPVLGEEGHVERVEVSPDSSGTLTTIGGNVGDRVARREWRIGEEKRGEELVGWICRTGLTEAEREQVKVAQVHSLNELKRVMYEQ
jgi:hypothetical protein